MADSHTAQPTVININSSSTSIVAFETTEQDSDYGDKTAPHLSATTASDSGSMIHQKPISSFRWAFLSDSWIPEICAVHLSIACACTVVILLAMWDQHSIPPLARGVTVNAIVSVLATASKSAMLFVVAACIAQLKWMWFRQSRPLAQIQIFDDATRGPLGAMWLLFTPTIASTASIGAVVTILALAFDPFVQQAVTTPVRPLSLNSSAAVVRQAFGFSDERSVGGTEVLQTISNAIWSTSSFDQSPICPVADCSWPAVKSVAVCYACKKVPSKIITSWNLSALLQEYQNDAANYSRYGVEVEIDDLPAINLSLATVSSWPSKDSNSIDDKTSLKTVISKVWEYESEPGLHIKKHNYTSKYPTRTGTVIVDNPIALYFQANVSWQDVEPHIDDTTMCALDICTKEYKISVQDNTPSVELIRWEFGSKYWRYWNMPLPEGLPQAFTSYNTEPPPGLAAMTCWQPFGTDPMTFDDYNFTVACPSAPDKFSFCDCTGWSAGELNLLDLMADNNALHGNTSQYSTMKISYQNDSAQAQRIPVSIAFDLDSSDFFFDSSDDYARHNQERLEDTIARIADALSARMLEQPNARKVTGQTIHMLPKVEVRWYWLVLPGLLTVTTALLLSLTIWLSHRDGMPLWKTSLVASFFHGLDPDIVLPKIDSRISRMEHEAEDMTVQLDRSDVPGKLVFRKRN